MNLRNMLESRFCRRAGWAYVVFWILISGSNLYALVHEAIAVDDRLSMGTTILIYIATATIFPVLIPGMTVTGGIHGGGVLDRPFAFWILTVPTFGWAIIGWWTLVSAVRRRARRSQ